VYYVTDKRGSLLKRGLFGGPLAFTSLQDAQARCEVGCNVIRHGDPDKPDALWVRREDGKFRKDKHGFETAWLSQSKA
jgi:hypothetical protein